MVKRRDMLKSFVFCECCLMKSLPGGSTLRGQKIHVKMLITLRCLSGCDWGASRKSLLNIYKTMMRARLNYGSVAYMSAAESHLKKLDVEQAKGLRICGGGFKTSPVAALQVEMGEEPLRIRRTKLMLAYGSICRAIKGLIQQRPY